jgi:hypothetical protein
MSKLTIKHPTDPRVHAEVGHDYAIGWFGDVVRRGPKRTRSSYSAIEPNHNQERPLWGLLTFLADHGFYTLDHLTEALDRLQYEPMDELPPKLQRVARIVWNIKATAER